MNDQEDGLVPGADVEEALAALRAKLAKDPNDLQSMVAFSDLAWKHDKTPALEQLYVWLGTRAGHEVAADIYERLFELYSCEDELEPDWAAISAQLATRVGQARAEGSENTRNLIGWLEDAIRNLGPDHPLPEVLQEIADEKAAKKTAAQAQKSKERAAATPLVLFIVGGVLVGLGGAFLALSWSGAQKSASVERWKGTPGKITKGWVHKRLRGANRTSYYYYPKVAYTYTVGGKQYTASRMEFGSPLRFQTRKKAAKALHSILEDPKVTVYYDPKRPSEAVLNRRSIQKISRHNVLGSGGMILVGLVLLVIGFVKRLQVRRNRS